MKYSATLHRKYHTAPLKAIIIDIPDNLEDEKRVVFAAHELLKQFSIEIDPIYEILGS